MHVSTGWKWLAVLIGFAVIAFLWALIGLTNEPFGWRVWRLVEGEDGSPSTSKFQWLLWMSVILFAYTVLWVLRARSGNYHLATPVPKNLLTLLGLSTATAAAAKGITTGYVQAGRISKGGTPQKGLAGLLNDDQGFPELAKIQMVGFTFLAAGIFIVSLVHQILSDPVQTGLPNIDTSLLALMGVSHGGYLGKKIVSMSGLGSSGATKPAPTTKPAKTATAGSTAVSRGAGGETGP